jgi:hypothetical protein
LPSAAHWKFRLAMLRFVSELLYISNVLTHIQLSTIVAFQFGSTWHAGYIVGNAPAEGRRRPIIRAASQVTDDSVI